MRTPYVWPTREEWTAKAEYSVRTRCTARERLPQGATFVTDEEAARARELAALAAKLLRPMLTAEIARLTALLPPKPTSRRTSEHVAWYLGLADEHRDNAGDLAGLVDIRKQVTKESREGGWGRIAWELSRIDKHYPQIPLRDDLLNAHHELTEIHDAVADRTDAEAKRLEDQAIAREVARRNSDQGWTDELKRRAEIDAGPKVTIHHTTATGRSA